MNMKNPQTVKPGDILYIPSSLYIDHGEDDVQGGKATVREVIYKSCGNSYNDYMVTFHEVPGVQYNLTHVLENQPRWSKVYGEQWAHPDPDYGTPLDAGWRF